MSKNTIHTNVMNPVDFYNFNCIQDCFDLILNQNNVVQTSIDSFSYIKNKGDDTKRMVIIEDIFFVPKIENGLGLIVNKRYTAFMLLQKVIFKNNFHKSINHVLYKHMHHEIDYIRVGVKFYKIISKTDRYGIKRTNLKLWDKSIINDDLGRNFLDDIPKYNDFVIKPDNKNYQKIIGDNYNLYSEFSHNICSKEDYKGFESFPWTHKFMKHIFGEHYDLGIKYIKILYDKPTQALPILVLISETRQTGKSTFVDYLNILFGDNSVVINPQDISNSFNGSYADKNVICIEESRFESTQATEKLKNLATQKKIMVNTKFVQHYSLPFFGHLIITSNDENKFSKVDSSEIRYWVRKVPKFKGKGNHQILDDMAAEIPYFLHYIDSLPEIDTTKSRMVFEAVELETEELKKVKSESLPGLHKDILIMLDDHCANNITVEYIKFTAKDIKEKFFNQNNSREVNYINKIIRDSIKLCKGKMQRYKPIEKDNETSNSVSGRPYVFKNEYYDSN